MAGSGWRILVEVARADGSLRDFEGRDFLGFDVNAPILILDWSGDLKKPVAGHNDSLPLEHVGGNDDVGDACLIFKREKNKSLGCAGSLRSIARKHRCPAPRGNSAIVPPPGESDTTLPAESACRAQQLCLPCRARLRQTRRLAAADRRRAKPAPDVTTVSRSLAQLCFCISPKAAAAAARRLLRPIRDRERRSHLSMHIPSLRWSSPR